MFDQDRVRGIIVGLRGQRHSFARIAELLNRSGWHSTHGGRWYGATVRALLLKPVSVERGRAQSR